jgi:WD40 repeat protein
MLQSAIFRIFSNGNALGTGFLVAKNLVVTCAHALEGAGEAIQVQFTGQGSTQSVRIVSKYWRDSENGDIAFLRLKRTPKDITPLRLGVARDSRPGAPFQTFGFPVLDEITGVHADGIILGTVTENGQSLLQLRSEELQQGHSGAPVWDKNRRLVVGMVVSVSQPPLGGKSQNTAFAIPTETLLEVCPEVRPSEIAPYLGLSTFTDESAEFFFGREQLTQKLLNVLKEGCSFLAIFGSSGSGKSSLVQAGLLPALAEGRVPEGEEWAQISMRPSYNPFEQIQAAGLELIDVNSYLKTHPDFKRVLLFIDQFEELFTLCVADVRNRFVLSLTVALNNPALILIVSMRDEFYSAFNAKAPSLAQSQYLKIENVPGTLKPNELIAMIEQPAERVGLLLEEGLTGRIIEDLTRDGEPFSSTLPLLEFALTQLWQKRRDGILTHEAYELIDGVTGSLTRWANDAYKELSDEVKPLAESLLTSLVHLGNEAQGLPDTRKRRDLEEFDDANRRLIKHFTDLHLLITSADGVELIHDALLREWSFLVGWLNENRSFLTWRQKLEERNAEWKDNKAELLRGRELAIAQTFWEQRPQDLVELQEYISKSAQQVKRINLFVISSISLTFIVLAVFAAFAWNQRNIALFSQQIATAGIATQAEAIANEGTAVANKETAVVDAGNVLSTSQARSTQIVSAQATSTAFEGTANEEAMLKLSASLSNQARSLIGTNYEQALLLGVEAYRVLVDKNYSDGRSPDTLPILLDQMEPGLIRNLKFSSGNVRKVLYAPNGSLMASMSDTLELWNTENPASPKPVKDWNYRSNSNVSDVQFSPNSELMVIGLQDGLIEIWAVSTLGVNKLHTLTDFASQSLANVRVAIGPDSKILAVAGNRTIKLWDISSPRSPQPIGRVPHPHELLERGVDINYLNFAPGSTSHFLISGGQDNLLRIWNLVRYGYNPPQPDGNAFEFDGALPHIALSTKFLILADKEAIRVFFYSNNEREFAGAFRYDDIHQGAIENLVISPNDKYLYTTAQDGQIAEWDLSDANHLNYIRTFGGPMKGINSMAFHPGGDFLVVSGNNSDLAIWDLRKKHIAQSWRDQLSNDSEITDVAYSPKLNFLALGDGEGSIVIWDVSNPSDITKALETAVRNPIRHIAFNPSETTLFVLGGYTNDAYRPAAFKRDLTQPWISDNPYLFGTDTDAFFVAGNDHVLAGEASTTGVTIFHWDISKLSIHKDTRPLGSSRCPSWDAAFTRNASLIAIATCNVQLWHFSDESPPSLIRELESVDSRGVAFNADGTLLASANTNSSISLWSILSNGEPEHLVTRSAHAGEVTSVAISPDGKMMASGGADQTVILWDITDPKNPTQRLVLDGHTSAVLYGSVFFLEDGKTLVSSSKNEITLWDVDPQSWIEKACNIAGRNLNQLEWEQFIGSNISYHTTCPDLPAFAN